MLRGGGLMGRPPALACGGTGTPYSTGGIFTTTTKYDDSDYFDNDNNYVCASRRVMSSWQEALWFHQY